eukprot:g63228.t1
MYTSLFKATLTPHSFQCKYVNAAQILESLKYFEGPLNNERSWEQKNTTNFSRKNTTRYFKVCYTYYRFSRGYQIFAQTNRFLMSQKLTQKSSRQEVEAAVADCEKQLAALAKLNKLTKTQLKRQQKLQEDKALYQGWLASGELSEQTEQVQEEQVAEAPASAAASYAAGEEEAPPAKEAPRI